MESSFNENSLLAAYYVLKIADCLRVPARIICRKKMDFMKIEPDFNNYVYPLGTVVQVKGFQNFYKIIRFNFDNSNLDAATYNLEILSPYNEAEEYQESVSIFNIVAKPEKAMVYKSSQQFFNTYRSAFAFNVLHFLLSFCAEKMSEFPLENFVGEKYKLLIKYFMMIGKDIMFSTNITVEARIQRLFYQMVEFFKSDPVEIDISQFQTIRNRILSKGYREPTADMHALVFNLDNFNAYVDRYTFLQLPLLPALFMFEYFDGTKTKLIIILEEVCHHFNLPHDRMLSTINITANTVNNPLTDEFLENVTGLNKEQIQAYHRGLQIQENDEEVSSTGIRMATGRTMEEITKEKANVPLLSMGPMIAGKGLTRKQKRKLKRTLKKKGIQTEKGGFLSFILFMGLTFVILSMLENCGIQLALAESDEACAKTPIVCGKSKSQCSICDTNNGANDAFKNIERQKEIKFLVAQNLNADYDKMKAALKAYSKDKLREIFLHLLLYPGQPPSGENAEVLAGFQRFLTAYKLRYPKQIINDDYFYYELFFELLNKDSNSDKQILGISPSNLLKVKQSYDEFLIRLFKNFSDTPSPSESQLLLMKKILKILPVENDAILKILNLPEKFTIKEFNRAVKQQIQLNFHPDKYKPDLKELATSVFTTLNNMVDNVPKNVFSEEKEKEKEKEKQGEKPNFLKSSWEEISSKFTQKDTLSEEGTNLQNTEKELINSFKANNPSIKTLTEANMNELFKTLFVPNYKTSSGLIQTLNNNFKALNDAFITTYRKTKDLEDDDKIKVILWILFVETAQGTPGFATRTLYKEDDTIVQLQNYLDNLIKSSETPTASPTTSPSSVPPSQSPTTSPSSVPPSRSPTNTPTFAPTENQRRQQERERKRKKAEEAERKKKEAEEAERKRKEAEEEAERKRKEAERKKLQQSHETQMTKVPEEVKESMNTLKGNFVFDSASTDANEINLQEKEKELVHIFLENNQGIKTLKRDQIKELFKTLFVPDYKTSNIAIQTLSNNLGVLHRRFIEDYKNTGDLEDEDKIQVILWILFLEVVTFSDAFYAARALYKKDDTFQRLSTNLLQLIDDTVNEGTISYYLELMKNNPVNVVITITLLCGGYLLIPKLWEATGPNSENANNNNQETNNNDKISFSTVAERDNKLRARLREKPLHTSDFVNIFEY
jgi:hypothetical protein